MEIIMIPYSYNKIYQKHIPCSFALASQLLLTREKKQSTNLLKEFLKK